MKEDELKVLVRKEKDKNTWGETLRQQRLVGKLPGFFVDRREWDIVFLLLVGLFFFFNTHILFFFLFLRKASPPSYFQNRYNSQSFSLVTIVCVFAKTFLTTQSVSSQKQQQQQQQQTRFTFVGPKHGSEDSHLRRPQ